LLELEWELLIELRAVADPAKASSMQKYMKSAMPYLGVQTPLLRSVCKKVFAENRFQAFEAWRDGCLFLWRNAKFREQRYAALELTGHRFYRDYQTMDTLPLYEEMIVTGAWWDYVDPIASHRLGGLLRRHRKPMSEEMRQWSRSKDRWKRRGAILCQLNFKEQTDLALLYECIEPSLGSNEFFLQKAIGWALRQYAWAQPREIQRYVRVHADRLSPLSIREALKNIANR
jgi:3-methyladenine DNA glycosylase AlkD